ncbi:MAG: MFS transporter [Aureliella sp.]
MLFRFCAYGFLKNQRYFEPFMMLALMAKDLSFFQIGILYSLRWLTLNLLEIASGAIADQWGRRRCMMLSFSAYVVSFLTFGFASDIASLSIAMMLFGIGDSFRTGTHKAMIFHWLKRQGREKERTKVYGTTRRWSKYGSGVSAILSAGFLLYFQRLDAIFFLAAIPCFLNLVNFVSYPKYLEHQSEDEPHDRQEGFTSGESKLKVLLAPWQALRATLGQIRKSRPIRDLLIESMAWEGVFHAVKDYLQPILVVFCARWFTRAAMVASTSSASTDATTDTATILVVATAYAALNFVSGWASGKAHSFSSWSGSTWNAQGKLWVLTITAYSAALLGCLWDDKLGIAVAIVASSLIAILILQNLWRPILISGLDEHGNSRFGATLLSIESQSQRATTMVLAPLLGIAVDWTSGGLSSGFQTHSIRPMWPIALLGLIVSIAILGWRRATQRRARKT